MPNDKGGRVKLKTGRSTEKKFSADGVNRIIYRSWVV